MKLSKYGERKNMPDKLDYTWYRWVDVCAALTLVQELLGEDRKKLFILIYLPSSTRRWSSWCSSAQLPVSDVCIIVFVEGCCKSKRG